jgi:hypothetical protein
LPKLLPEDRQREEAIGWVRRVLAARGALSEEGRHRLDRVEALLAAPPAKVGREKAA